MNPVYLALSVISNADLKSSMRARLTEAGHKLVETGSLRQAQALMTNGFVPDIILLEWRRNGCESGKQIKRFLKLAKRAPVIAMSEHDNEEMRGDVDAAGISFFSTTDSAVDEIGRVLARLREAGSQPTQGLAHPVVRGLTSNQDCTSGKVFIEELGDSQFFLAASPTMRNIHRQVRLLADSDVPVLILGESGTGKEVIANLIHEYSQRSRHRFLKLNCAAVPCDLLESELFGHLRGAFTGAIRDRAGKFEQAHRGTLLLDEIGEMTAQMQAKLLHVLQDGQFTRLGAQESSRSDVRILAATNVHMENALQEKRFREDLYYRLSVFTIQIPPLRERREEIPFLIEEFIRRTSLDLIDNCQCIFSQKLMDAALQHEWRGNLRELRNFVTRTIILRDTDAALQDLESRIAPAAAAVSKEPPNPPVQPCAMRSVISHMKDQTEVQMIQDALEVSGWNRRHAAKYLNISYRGLLYKIQQHRIMPRLHREIHPSARIAHAGRS